jgi:hypothetical protein
MRNDFDGDSILREERPIANTCGVGHDTKARSKYDKRESTFQPDFSISEEDDDSSMDSSDDSDEYESDDSESLHRESRQRNTYNRR